MTFSAKLLMEHILLLVVMPTLLLADGPDTSTHNTTLNKTTSYVSSKTFTTQPVISSNNRSTVRLTVHQLPPVLGRMNVKWEKKSPCQGKIWLTNIDKNPMPICVQSENKLEALSKELCEERRCGEFLNFKFFQKEKGYIINDNLTVITRDCKTISITCKDNNELLAYKAVTALLLVLILAAILCRFARPMYIAFNKRFSQKRQNRWVGPTQSQSVSYHRGQNQLKNDTVKRQSYPGLERLSVNHSREPSSNRNSDYDSYGYS